MENASQYRQVQQETGKDDWGSILADQRNYQARGKADNPALYTTMEMGTGVLQGGAMGMAGAGAKTAGKQMLGEAAQTMEAAPWLAKIGRTSGVGAVEGAASGYLGGEGAGESLGDATLGAGLGGLLGMLPLTVDIYGAAKRWGKRAFSSNTDKADEIVGARLAEQFGDDAEGVVGAMNDISPEAVLADLDPMGAAAAAGRSTEARREMGAQLAERQAGQTSRVTGILRDEIADLPEPSDAVLLLERLAKQRRSLPAG